MHKASSGQGVAYMMIRHLSHALRLAVSIFTLRKHYDGPVVVFVDNATESFVKEHFAKCKILNVTPVRFDADLTAINGKRNFGYAAKSTLPQITPFRETLFLDADTVIVKSIGRLFDGLEFTPLIVTSFSDWRTTNKPVRCRLKKWIQKPNDLMRGECWRSLIQTTIDTGMRAINTGVYSFRGHPSTLELWRQITFSMADHFICDELAMQVVASSADCEVLPDSFNYSPLYGQSKPEDISIVHFHGGKHTRGEAIPYFLPAYNEAVSANAANLQEWAPGNDIALSELINRRKT